MFNYLIDKYPETVEVNGKEYSVLTGFKDLIALQEISRNELFTQLEKNMIILKSFFKGNPPEEKEAAIHEYEEFLSCYQPKERNAESDTNGEMPLDFCIDSQRIFSAFFYQYGIDLNESDMHWFRFIALLNGLCDGTPQLLRVIDYRTKKITTDMSKEEASFYNRMRDKYSIMDPEEARKERMKRAKEIEDKYLAAFQKETKGE